MLLLVVVESQRSETARLFHRAAGLYGIHTSSEPGLHVNIPHPSVLV